jgi:hypothetical protein
MINNDYIFTDFNSIKIYIIIIIMMVINKTKSYKVNFKIKYKGNFKIGNLDCFLKKVDFFPYSPDYKILKKLDFKKKYLQRYNSFIYPSILLNTYKFFFYQCFKYLIHNKEISCFLFKTLIIRLKQIYSILFLSKNPIILKNTELASILNLKSGILTKKIFLAFSEDHKNRYKKKKTILNNSKKKYIFVNFSIFIYALYTPRNSVNVTNSSKTFLFIFKSKKLIKLNDKYRNENQKTLKKIIRIIPKLKIFDFISKFWKITKKNIKYKISFGNMIYIIFKNKLVCFFKKSKLKIHFLACDSIKFCKHSFKIFNNIFRCMFIL